MKGRDKLGRFAEGNPFAANGGRVRAERLSSARRKEIARMGFNAMVQKRFGGDRQAAINFIVAKGLAAVDAHYAPELRKFHDPGDMPGGEG